MQAIEIPYLGIDSSNRPYQQSPAAVALTTVGHSSAESSLNTTAAERWHPVLPNDPSGSIELIESIAENSAADVEPQKSALQAGDDLLRADIPNQPKLNDAVESPNLNAGLLPPSLVSPLPETQASIERLVASILEKFPLGDPTVISFVCSERNPHLELTCVAACRTLAAMHVGTVLLIDSTTDRKLTSHFNMADHPGLSNLLVDPTEWEATIESLPASDLEFLPAGTSHWEHWGGEVQLRKLVSQLKNRFQFILVASGEAHAPMAKLWSGLTDGDYLLVSVANSHPAVAQSAISELQTSGARLTGCIVTDFH